MKFVKQKNYELFLIAAAEKARVSRVQIQNPPSMLYVQSKNTKQNEARAEKGLE